MSVQHMVGATGYSGGSNEPPDFNIYIYILYKIFFKFNTLIYS